MVGRQQKRKCPRCGEEIVKYPATSRRVSKDICDPCGTDEALTDIGHKPQRKILKTWRHKP